jgi:hypothetical protein
MRSICAIGMWLSFFCAEARDRSVYKLLPDHAKVQIAGNLGLLSAGAGYSFLSGRVQPALLYGFSPASVTGSDIHTIANKNTIRIYQYPVSSTFSLALSAGFSLNYSITENTYLFFPSYYPGQYHRTNALRAAPFISLHFIFRKEGGGLLQNMRPYVEAGTLDNYAWYAMRTRSFGFAEIWNLAVGVNIPLRKSRLTAQTNGMP